MSSADKLNIKISPQSSGSITNKKVHSLGEFVSRVNNLKLEQELKDEIILYISKYPQDSLDYAWGRIHHIINTCQNKLVEKKTGIVQQPLQRQTIKKPVEPVQPDVKVIGRKKLPQKPPTPEQEREEIAANLEDTNIEELKPVKKPTKKDLEAEKMRIAEELMNQQIAEMQEKIKQGII